MRPASRCTRRNLRTYQLLRYGVPVQIDGRPGARDGAPDRLGEARDANDFALAEEVTLKGGESAAHQRRPDLVLYLNGLRDRGDRVEAQLGGVGGRRAPADHQPGSTLQPGLSSAPCSSCWRAATAQGLRYGTTGTPEQFFVEWKDEDATAEAERECRRRGAAGPGRWRSCATKVRLLDLIRNFILFDGGQKKVPRPHQFFGVKAAQARMVAARGRRDLAHAGQRQEHPDGADREVAAGARPCRRASWSSPTGTSWTSRSSR
jgi:type I restriction enzyme R subunit